MGLVEIANLSFGLPPFGRVPSFELRIANLRQSKVKYSYPMSQAWKRYDLTPLTGYCWLGKKRRCGRRPGWSRAGAFHFSEEPQPGCFMNCCGETVKMTVPPGNRRVLDPRRT